MCCFVQPMWRTFVSPAKSCSRQLYMSLVIRWYSRRCVLTHRLAKHLADTYRRPVHNVRSLPCSGSYELRGFLQHECCYSSLPSVAPQRVVQNTSRSLSSICCNKTKTVGRESPVSFHQSRHYIPRQLTSSTKTIVDASPLSLQPYLRLIRFDRPIGIAVFISCLFT